ncbi:hypothetical protein F0919_14500 [Taibaiella lutea]|uniref:Intracellular proteinase inhibitor BsuPI domain-containing protein n=1 Tax=Taibaiella lutea TaxID=2608001 RepID=A0A5M6CKT2_9BACT|nr:hypothetical protein [Taibaiella lutea]KAA5533739.1 hypothetical protein F0919_14500 [Taibaiella lutea]
MKRIGILFFAYLLFIPICKSQELDLCVNIELSSNKESLVLETSESLNVYFTITNCSLKELLIDTTELPNYEIFSHSDINFTITYYNKKTHNWEMYPYTLKDIGLLTDISKNTVKKLKKGQSYTFRYNFLDFYGLKDRGEYRIYAYYKKALLANKGYYVKDSNNYLKLSIK